MKNLFAVLLIMAGLICPTLTVVKNIQFAQNCGGYLKQAADANSVELALKRINLAIDYIEKNNLTTGYTSVCWKTENDNIGFWYENLKECQMELNSALGSSQLEKTNVLMKVRESLTDNEGKEGTVLNVPVGISRYPYNAIIGIFNTISAILLIIGLTILIVDSY